MIWSRGLASSFGALPRSGFAGAALSGSPSLCGSIIAPKSFHHSGVAASRSFNAVWLHTNAHFLDLQRCSALWGLLGLGAQTVVRSWSIVSIKGSEALQSTTLLLCLLAILFASFVAEGGGGWGKGVPNMIMLRLYGVQNCVCAIFPVRQMQGSNLRSLSNYRCFCYQIWSHYTKVQKLFYSSEVLWYPLTLGGEPAIHEIRHYHHFPTIPQIKSLHSKQRLLIEFEYLLTCRNILEVRPLLNATISAGTHENWVTLFFGVLN